MSERCPKCDREGCDGGESIQDQWREAGGFADTRNDGLLLKAQQQRSDCNDHLIDWRAQTLALHAEVARLREAVDKLTILVAVEPSLGDDRTLSIGYWVRVPGRPDEFHARVKYTVGDLRRYRAALAPGGKGEP